MTPVEKLKNVIKSYNDEEYGLVSISLLNDVIKDYELRTDVVVNEIYSYLQQHSSTYVMKWMRERFGFDKE